VASHNGPTESGLEVPCGKAGLTAKSPLSFRDENKSCEVVIDVANSLTRILLKKGLATCFNTTKHQAPASDSGMGKEDSPQRIMPLLNHYVQSLCGLYSRVARQLNVDRSYVSRVARGERRSEEVERELSTEFKRITNELQ
jgi:hypothetical protein